jgi:acyl carrier protein/NADP-dependent 3-hydroxy acid dehydrogenase YdfG
MQLFAPQPAAAQAMQLFAPQPVASSFMQHAILSLQRMQEQNAELHRQFLQNQMASQAMLFGLLGNPSAAAYAPAPASLAPPAYAPQPAAFAPPAYAPQPAAFAPPAYAPQAAASASPAFAAQPFSPAPRTAQAAGFAPAAPAPQSTAFAASVPAPQVQESKTTRAGAYANGSAGAPRPATGAASDLIRETLLAIVSEKTGYPVDMVDPGMSLEGDLGIDSIKRVEILAELQARLPAAGSVKPEELTKLATLNEIISKLAAGAPAQVAPKAAAAVASAAQAPAAAAAPATAASGSKAEIAAALVDIVAEKTGYPPDMVGLDMQIEGDLGIDSIKRVEILSALQEKVPAAKAAPADLLSRCKTLAEIAETAASAAVQKKNLATTSEPPASQRSSAPPALELDVYAVEMAAAPAPGAIFLAPTPERRSFVVAAADPADDLARAFAKALEGRGFIARLVALASAAQESTGLVAGLAILAPRGESAAAHKTRAFLLNAFRATRAHAAALRGAAQPTRLMSVSFAGGRFAHGGAPSADAARHAAVAGLVKTAGHEWPDVRTLAVDADPALAVEQLAAQLADEALRFGPSELGLTSAERLSPRLAKIALPQASTGAPRQEGGLVVVSGGARGVTAQSILALARMRRHAFLVLGRSPMPAPEPAWLESLTEPAAIKHALVANATGKLSPRELQTACDAVLNAREMRATLAGLVAAGCPASYRAVDTRDGEALRAAVAEAVAEHGPVRGVVHGAGVLADRLIDAQTDEQFLSVYDTKVLGLDALLAAVDPAQLSFVALFSSTTARLGRKGQGAYAVANEALNKAAQALAASRPGLKIVSLGWGPWAGGMVSPALAKLFAEEGIALVGLDAGAQLFAQTLTAGGRAPVEQVVVGAGTRLVEMAPETPVTPPAAHADEIAAFDIEASVAGIPVLEAHVLGGRAVVPAALLMEWMALAAVHLNPGLEVVGLDRFRVLKGVVLDATDTRRLRVAAQRLQLAGDAYVVPVSIVSERADGHVVRHAAAEVRLADLRPGAPAPQLPRIVEAAGTDPERVYLEDLFHGPAMQGIESLLGRNASGVSALVKAAPAPAAWWSAAPRAAWLTEPLAVDVAFQLMVLWTKAVHGAPTLPSAVHSYRQFQRQFPAEGCEARLCVTEHSAHKAVGDIEFLAPDGTLVARLEAYEATIDQSLARAFARRALEETQG